MDVQVENLERNMVRLTVTLPEDLVEDAMQRAYLKRRSSFRVPGFRKGKVPRQLMEKMYGPEVFYDDAIDIMLGDHYGEAADESGVEITSRPKVDVKQIEKGKPFIFTAEAARRPDVTLGEYRGVSVSKIETTVTDEEVEENFQKELERNSRLVEKEEGAEIAEGDTAVIDYKGTVDGTPFDGGSAEAYPLEIGSHTFIGTFEEQLVGKKAGEDVQVHVTFPEDYAEKVLAGRDATFDVNIRSIRHKEAPDLEDFVEDAGFDTVDEMKDDLRKRMTEQKETDAKKKREDEAIQKIMDASEMDIPDPMVDFQIDSMVNEFASGLSMQGMSLQQYFQFSGETMDSVRDQMRDEATRRIRSSLVLDEVVRQEGIEVSDEEFAEEVRQMAARYHVKEEEMDNMMKDRDKKDLRHRLGVEKAIALIMDNVTEEEA